MTDGGRVTARVAVPMLRDYLNRCAAEGIELRNVRAEDLFTCVFSLRPEDASRAEKLAHRCGGEWERLNESGLPRLRRRVRRRAVLCAGVALLFVALCAASLFVWDIRVTENDSAVPDAEILWVLAEQGVGVGSFAPAFRAERIRTAALCALPELSFLAVNVRNGRAEVTVRALREPPEIWDSERKANIVATASGVVDGVRTLAGNALVKRGETVTAGQTLIEGTAAEPHARGEVQAYTFRELTASAPLTAWEKTPFGAARRRFFLLLGQKQIKISPGSSIFPLTCDKITYVWELSVPGAFSLPVKLAEEVVQPFQLTAGEREAETVRLQLEEALRTRLAETLGENGQVLTEHFTVCSDGALLTVTLRAQCLERIDRDLPLPP